MTDTFTKRVLWGSGLLRLMEDNDSTAEELLQRRSTFMGLSLSELQISWLMRMAGSGYGVEEVALVVPEIDKVWEQFNSNPGNRYREVMEYIYDF